MDIAAERVEEFRQQVRATLKATEQLCASARMMPAQLPTPSRKAYAFLKQLDLMHLPIINKVAAIKSHTGSGFVNLPNSMEIRPKRK